MVLLSRYCNTCIMYKIPHVNYYLSLTPKSFSIRDDDIQLPVHFGVLYHKREVTRIINKARFDARHVVRRYTDKRK